MRSQTIPPPVETAAFNSLAYPFPCIQTAQRLAQKDPGRKRRVFPWGRMPLLFCGGFSGAMSKCNVSTPQRSGRLPHLTTHFVDPSGHYSMARTRVPLKGQTGVRTYPLFVCLVDDPQPILQDSRDHPQLFHVRCHQKVNPPQLGSIRWSSALLPETETQRNKKKGYGRHWSRETPNTTYYIVMRPF